MHGIPLTWPLMYTSHKKSFLVSESAFAVSGRTALELALSNLTDQNLEDGVTMLKSTDLPSVDTHTLRTYGVKCMELAAKSDMDLVVATLMPHFQDFIWAAGIGLESEQVASILLSGVKYSESCLLRMLEWNWPAHILRIVRQDPLVANLLPRTQQLLERMEVEQRDRRKYYRGTYRSDPLQQEPTAEELEKGPKW
jgi:hypothetical protein